MSPARKGHIEIPKTPERFRIKLSIPKCSELAHKGISNQNHNILTPQHEYQCFQSQENNVNLQS